jgi:apolipoprotein D and lipocalin family protein
MRKILFLSILTVLLTSCGGHYAPLKTVDNVNLDKYIGKWYEIAAFPQIFEKGCNCTTAEYSKTDGNYIRVINSCRKDSVNGMLKSARGKAFIVLNTNNSKLKVQFFWPFKGDYWIIYLAGDYSYAVVGHPNRKYLWILARKPTMDDTVYGQLTDRIKAMGFDITKLKRTVQQCAK